MSRITETTESVLRRVIQMSKLVPSVERHLLADQADAIGASSSNTGGSSGGGISDPTARLALAHSLAHHAWQERQLLRAIGRIDKALNEAERDVQYILTGNTPIDDAGIRCPGWNAELRARLGGCGKPIEHWTDAKGVQHNRSTLLCTSCRKAEERASATEGAA